MEPANAFIAHPAQPTPAEISASLGSSDSLWQEIVHWIADQGATEEEWKSYSPKYGWSLRMKRKKRTIVYLSPCSGCVRVGFLLGDRAVAAARESSLSKAVLKDIEQARRYAEGTGVHLIVKRARDLAAVKKLVLIKMAN
ncbi:MAG TPA: DUF3788 domain-containing protein [Terracidiphilus sp.]|nr:DUF3788 domain-containing protein [Terracidiphilus sp.]